MAASGTPAVTSIAERPEIHKSCKSLETLINTLNDYCEAASAVVQLQKKLAKALRETASLKVTGEVPGNVFTACAMIFEVSSDVDSKFSKIADKEYDAVSGEVKKWFKKLAKEEKAHDERILSANAKIKQAGQLYEKKSKKNVRDAMEEHQKYMNLISSLGPEISQEKYNHALDVSQRNLATTYTVAAALSRVTEAEWQRSCENVRRFASTIGPLGEWRALCEGGWSGDVPRDLPDIGEELQHQKQQLSSPLPTTPQIQHSETQLLGGNQQLHTPQSSAEPESAEEVVSPLMFTRDIEPGAESESKEQKPAIWPVNRSVRDSGPPPSAFEASGLHRGGQTDTGSIRSLSAFPSPPTHFPIPTMSSGQGRSPLSQSIRSNSGSVGFPSQGTNDEYQNTGSSQQSQRQGSLSSDPTTRITTSPEPDSMPVEEGSVLGRRPLPRQPVSPPRDNIGREFGVLDRKASANGDGDRSSAKATDSPTGTKARGQLERTDTGASNESYVAAMRNRYASPSTPSPSSPPIPTKGSGSHKLPVSVSDLASKYEPIDGSPASPTILRERASSPPLASRRQSLPPLDIAVKSTEASFSQSPTSAPLQRTHSSNVVAESPLPAHREEDEVTIRKEGELLERERKLRELETAIQQRERDLEQGRTRLYSDASPASAQLRPRHTSFQQPRPASYAPTSPSGRPPVQHSFTGPGYLSPPAGRDPSYDGRSISSSTNGHASACGCEACSASKYAQRSPHASAYDLRPPERPPVLRPERPKGWIRRLSMDVGNAFSSDSKKGLGISSNNYSVNTTKSVGGGGGMFSLDNKKNVSSTALNRGVQEDGRYGDMRRSYEAAAGANRSVTNLGRRL